MKKNIYSTLSALPARYALALAAMAGSVSVALADGKISLQETEKVLKPGEEMTFGVYLEQDGDVFSLQTDMKLPEGLDITFKENETLASSRHEFRSKQLDDETYRLAVLGRTYPIKGNGQLFEITLRANETFKGGDILFSDILITTINDDNDTFEKAQEGELKLTLSSNYSELGHFSVPVAKMDITADGGPYMVSLSLDNTLAINGLEGRIILPDGMTMKLKEGGYPDEYAVTNGANVPKSAEFQYNPETGKFIFNAFSTEEWGTHIGEIFSFEVETNDALKSRTQIVIKDLVVSRKSGEMTSKDELTIEVDNSAAINSIFDKLYGDIDGVISDCESAISFISENCPNAGTSYVEELSSLKSSLESEKQRVQELQNTDTLPKDVTLQYDLDVCRQNIADTKAAAEAAEKQAVNNSVYTTAKAQIEAVQTVLKSARETIAGECGAVAGNYDTIIDGYAEEVAALAATLEDLYGKGELTQEYSIESETTDLTARIEATVAEAKAGQAAAVKAVYDALIGQLNALEGVYSEVWNMVQDECADVAENYLEELENNYRKQMDDLRGEVESEYAEGTLVLDKTIDTATIQTALTTLGEEAKNALKAFVNEQKYNELSGILQEVESEFGMVSERIANECRDVAGQFAEDLQEIESAISTLQESLEAQYRQGELTAESSLQTAEVTAKMDQTWASAQAAQKAFVNLKVYGELDGQLKNLEGAFEEAKEKIRTEFAYVAAEFEEDLQGIETDIQALRTGVREKFEQGALTADYSIESETVDLTARIARTVAAAEQAQQNAVAGHFSTLSQQLDGVESQCQAVKAQVETECAEEVAAEFLVRVDEEFAKVAQLRAELKSMYEEGRLTMETTVETADIEHAVQQIAEEALHAQKVFVNDKKYEELSALVAGLQAKLDAAKERVATDYADVYDEATFETLQKEVDALKEDLELRYSNVKLTADSSVDTASVEQRVNQAVIDAQKAHGDNIGARYTELSLQIDALEGEYHTAYEEVQQKCGDVASRFEEDFAAQLAAITTLREELDATYNNGELTTDSTVDTATVQDAIGDIVTRAMNMQSKIIYDHLEAQQVKVTTLLANAQKAMDGLDADIYETYMQHLDEVETALTGMVNEIETAVADNKYAMDLGFGLVDMVALYDKVTETLATAKDVQRGRDDAAIQSELEATAQVLADVRGKLQLDVYTDVREGCTSMVDGQEQALAEMWEMFENGEYSKEHGQLPHILDGIKSITDNLNSIMELANTEVKLIHENAIARLEAELEGYKERYDALDAKLQGYAHCDYEAFQTDGNFADCYDVDKAILEAAKAATEPAEYLKKDAALAFEGYAELLGELDKTYSHNEAAWQLENLRTLVEEAYAGSEGYEMFEQDKVAGKYAEICDAVAGMTDKEAADFLGAVTTEEYAATTVPEILKSAAELLSDIEALQTLVEENRYQYGDANHDGKVRVNDYMMILRHMLQEELIEESTVCFAAADVNGDGEVDIADLTTTANIIKGAYSKPVSAPAVAENIDDVLSIRCEGEGVHQRIGIFMDASRLYAGAQMDIQFPEGVRLSEEKLGEMAESMNLFSSDLENGSHRIIITSLDGCQFGESDAAIVWLDVEVDHNYNGQAIEISNIRFSDANGNLSRFSAVSGDTTGLSTVSITGEVKEKIYNVGGMLMDGLKRGVNIIRGNDGSSKKVYVK